MGRLTFAYVQPDITVSDMYHKFRFAVLLSLVIQLLSALPTVIPGLNANVPCDRVSQREPVRYHRACGGGSKSRTAKRLFMEEFLHHPKSLKS